MLHPLTNKSRNFAAGACLRQCADARVQAGRHERTEAMHGVLSDQHVGVSGVQAIAGSLDGIIDTVSANHPLSDYLALLGLDGKLVVVGAPPEPLQLPTPSLIFGCALLLSPLIPLCQSEGHAGHASQACKDNLW